MLPKDEKGNFIAGDERVQENIALTSFSILFYREHNRLCNKIVKEYPRLCD